MDPEVGACPWCTALDPPLLFPKVEYKQKHSVADPRAPPVRAPLRPKIFSISGSFGGNLTKSYVGAPEGWHPLLQVILNPLLLLIIVQCISVEKLTGKYTRKLYWSVPMCHGCRIFVRRGAHKLKTVSILSCIY